MAVCLERAFGNLKLFCMVNKLLVTGVRSFTVANMHAAKNAYPFLGCKGSDTPVILKWLCFYVGLQLGDTSWPAEDRKALEWMLAGARAGLSFTQGIHGHGIWLSSSCARFLRNAVQSFGNCYAHLAEHCLNKRYSLFGCVPKLHAHLHFRSDFDDAIAEGRLFTLNPAIFDCSMSEDFVGRISRQSRRVSFRNIERSVLKAYQMKAKFVISKFQRQNQLKKKWKKLRLAPFEGTMWSSCLRRKVASMHELVTFHEKCSGWIYILTSVFIQWRLIYPSK